MICSRIALPLADFTLQICRNLRSRTETAPGGFLFTKAETSAGRSHYLIHYGTACDIKLQYSASRVGFLEVVIFSSNRSEKIKSTVNLISIFVVRN